MKRGYWGLMLVVAAAVAATGCCTRHTVRAELDADEVRSVVQEVRAMLDTIEQQRRVDGGDLASLPPLDKAELTLKVSTIRSVGGGLAIGYVEAEGSHTRTDANGVVVTIVPSSRIPSATAGKERLSFDSKNFQAILKAALSRLSGEKPSDTAVGAITLTTLFKLERKGEAKIEIVPVKLEGSRQTAAEHSLTLSYKFPQP